MLFTYSLRKELGTGQLIEVLCSEDFSLVFFNVFYLTVTSFYCQYLLPIKQREPRAIEVVVVTQQQVQGSHIVAMTCHVKSHIKQIPVKAAT